MIAKKSDDKKPVGENSREPLLKKRDLDWYGDAYEQLYMAKLQIDVQLKDLAAKLQPRTTTVH